MTDTMRGRRPLLYPLVYIASLSLVVASAAALGMLGHEHVIDGSIQVAVTDDQAIVSEFAASNLTTNDLDGALLAPQRRAELETLLADLARDHGYRGVSVVTAGEGLVASTNLLGGDPPSMTDGVARALSTGRSSAAITPGATAGAPILVEAMPVLQGPDVVAVFAISRDAAPILAAAGEALRDALIVTTSSAVVLAVLLYAIFHAATLRLRRQDAELVETRRRDPLTGLLNHGTAVGLLTELVESARADASSLGVALFDLDNFRLLNDVHGQTVGDQALLGVAEAFRPTDEQWAALSRFGPDEFMAVAPASVARNLPAAAQRVRERLEDSHLQLSDSERLPITVSVGVAYFPFHAGSVIELMSAATTALAEAKADGGNQISIANAWTSEPRAPHTTFDVLQGLVLAIDRKDRYTKLHSEDVAAYALFLADRLDLPEEERASLRVAALLHDVGKVGIPDDILRKPGRLTPHEYEIVKQHVALGDLIVRDVPDVEHIREGVRYHHERWDGKGYMAGLAGDGIPEIARVLAVADAFSAMTTSRPYRKAMPTERALDELRAVAGSQLDAAFVEAFVGGMELDPNAPQPGALRNSKTLWAPASQAA